MNDTMTHCGIFGPIVPENLDSPYLTNICVRSGDYIRLIQSKPNENNFVYQQAFIENCELEVHSKIEEDGTFKLVHGMTLEEWANITFRKVERDEAD